MSIVNYSYARQNLASLMDEVGQDCGPVFITRRSGRGGAVLVSQDDWDSIQETLHLTSNPRNAALLREAIAQAERGELEPHDLIEP